MGATTNTMLDGILSIRQIITDLKGGEQSTVTQPPYPAIQLAGNKVTQMIKSLEFFEKEK